MFPNYESVCVDWSYSTGNPVQVLTWQETVEFQFEREEDP